MTDVGAVHNLVPAQLFQVMGASRLEPAFTAQSHHWNATTNCCANQATELDDDLSVQPGADKSSRWNYNGDQAESAAAHITCQGVAVANQQLGCAEMCQRCCVVLSNASNVPVSSIASTETPDRVRPNLVVDVWAGGGARTASNCRVLGGVHASGVVSGLIGC